MECKYNTISQLSNRKNHSIIILENNIFIDLTSFLFFLFFFEKTLILHDNKVHHTVKLIKIRKKKILLKSD